MALKPTLQISAQLDAKKSKDMIQQQLNKMGDKLTVTIGVDKSGKSEKQLKEYSKRISNIDEAHLSALKQEQKMIDDIHTKALKIDREVNASLKSRDSVLKEEQKTRYAIQKSTDKQVESEKLVSNELDKQRQKLANFQAEFNRKSTKLTSGKFGGTVDSDALSSLQAKTNMMSIGSVDDIKSVQAEMDKVSSKFKDITLNAQQSRTGITRFGDDIKHNFQKFSEYMVIGSIFMGITNQIGQAVKASYELDNALNQIRIVTGQSAEEVRGLTETFKMLGSQANVSLVDTAKLYADLTRQGLKGAPLEERFMAISKYSKISGLDVTKSMDIITSAVNGTKRPVNEIIDVFAVLGDESSAGSAEIGEALQRTASVAAVAGVDFKKLASYIATVSETTRTASSVVGASMRSMIVRFNQLREEGFNSDDTTKINDVVKALSAIGIDAFDDSTQSLMNFSEILEQLAPKWDTLDEKTRNYIQTSLAGNYQADKFAALMSNFGRSQELYAKALDSSGVATEKFKIYQESAQAKTEQFNLALENLYTNTINSEGMKMLIDFGISVLKLVDSIGIGTIAITVLTTALLIFTPTLISATVAVKGFTLALMANPIGLIIAGISIAVGLLAKTLFNYIDSSNKASASHRNLMKTISETSDTVNSKLNTQKETTKQLIQSVSDLTDVEKLNAEQKNRILDVQSELVKQNPAMLKYLDKEKTGVEQLIDAYNRYQQDVIGVQRMANDVELSNAKNRKKILEDRYGVMRTENAGGYRMPRDPEIENQLKQLTDEIKLREQQQQQLKTLYKPMTKKEINPDKVAGTPNGDDKKTSTPSIIQSIDLQKERYASLTMALNSVNNELEKNKSLQENTTDLTALNNLREDEISILKKKQIAIQNLTKEQQKERNELVKSLNAQGISFSGKGDSAKALNAEKTLNGLIDKMNALKGKSDKASTQMFANLQSRYKTVKEEFDRFAQLQLTDIPKLQLDYEGLSGSINKVATSITDDLLKASEEADKEFKKLIQGNIDLLEKDLKKALKDAEDAIESENKSALKSLEDRLDGEEKALKKSLDSQEKAFKTNLDLQEKALEESLNAQEKYLENLAKTSEDSYNNRIQAIKDEMEQQGLQNEIIADQISLQEKLKKLSDLKAKRANIESQREVRMLGATGWEFIADPEKLKENAEQIADAEKDLIEFEGNIKLKESKRIKDTQIKLLEQQRDAEKLVHDKRLEDFKITSRLQLETFKTNADLQMDVFKTNSDLQMETFKTNAIKEIDAQKVANEAKLANFNLYSDLALESAKSNNAKMNADLDSIYAVMTASDAKYWSDKLALVTATMAQIRAQQSIFNGGFITPPTNISGGSTVSSSGSGTPTAGVTQYHSGIEKGLVGNIPLPKNWEQLAMLAKGEGVFTAPQMNNISNFINSAIPKMTTSSNSNSNIYNFDKLILNGVQDVKGFMNQLSKYRVINT